MRTWRFIATKVRDATSGTESWEVREFYPEDNGRFSYTARGMSPGGDNLGELIRDLSHMAADMRGPWLDLTGDEPRVIEEPPTGFTR